MKYDQKDIKWKLKTSIFYHFDLDCNDSAISYSLKLDRVVKAFKTNSKRIYTSIHLATYELGLLREGAWQYKNDCIWFKTKLGLKLPRFFTRLFGVWKNAANSNLVCSSTKWQMFSFLYCLCSRLGSSLAERQRIGCLNN